jgi:hypothetical protein
MGKLGSIRHSEEKAGQIIISVYVGFTERKG